jgi:oxygen-independent coproporphyrinogen-3 oxidase
VSGIYIHIPFCKQRCNYCNFHFTTQLQHIDSFITALKTEITLQKSYLDTTTLQTLYFGGGTPSVLSIPQIAALLKHLEDTLGVSLASLQEITFEVNPDDITLTYLQELKSLGINRLSIGIQSFKEVDLAYMQRAHNIQQSHQAIQLALECSFTNVSIDLIYGIPNLSNEEWIANIQTAINYGVPHLSAYALTVERQISQKKLPPLDDEQAATQFRILVDTLQAQGYEQYEISNFALPNHYAIHNTNYWNKKHYLGLGPSAHSFNGNSRQWNIANNALYIQSLKNNQLHFEITGTNI